MSKDHQQLVTMLMMKTMMMTLRLSSTQLSCWTSTSANSPPPLLEAFNHDYDDEDEDDEDDPDGNAYDDKDDHDFFFHFHLIHIQVFLKVLQVISNVHTEVNIVLF